MKIIVQDKIKKNQNKKGKENIKKEAHRNSNKILNSFYDDNSKKEKKLNTKNFNKKRDEKEKEINEENQKFIKSSEKVLNQNSEEDYSPCSRDIKRVRGKSHHLKNKIESFNLFKLFPKEFRKSKKLKFDLEKEGKKSGKMKINY